jgi:hypothetical protein
MNPPLPDNKPADNQQIIDQIDTFIAGLNPPPGTTVATSVVTKTVGQPKPDEIKVEPPKTDEDMKHFVLKHSAELVENSVKSIMELQKLTVATGDPEMMAGLASLIAASTGAIETVNKMHIQNKKFEDAKELKKLDLEGKKEIQRLKNDGYLNLPAGNTNILVATREEIIAQLTGKAKAKAIEGTIEVVTLSGAELQVAPYVVPTI